MQEFAKSFYKSKKWKKCRNTYIAKRIQIDGGLCEICHEVPGYIVHHKKHLTQENITNPEISLNEANLSYECIRCHDAHEGHGWTSVEPLVDFDINGQPIPKKPPIES